MIREICTSISRSCISGGSPCAAGSEDRRESDERRRLATLPLGAGLGEFRHRAVGLDELESVAGQAPIVVAKRLGRSSQRPPSLRHPIEEVQGATVIADRTRSTKLLLGLFQGALKRLDPLRRARPNRRFGAALPQRSPALACRSRTCFEVGGHGSGWHRSSRETNVGLPA